MLLGSIVRESNLGGSDRKLPQRRMNTWVEINNRCVVGNSVDRNRKLKEVMMLAKSLEEVNRTQQVSKSNKEADEMKEMHAKAPEAIAKYIAKGCDASKLTIPELEAVARAELATTLKGKDNVRIQGVRNVRPPLHLDENHLLRPPLCILEDHPRHGRFLEAGGSPGE